MADTDAMTVIEEAVGKALDGLAAGRALLVGLSGIDGAGKGFIAARLVDRLTRAGHRVAPVNVDGWLNPPARRFAAVEPGRHFYEHALRLDELFARLIVPLHRDRSVRVRVDHAEETASEFQSRLIEFDRIDVIVLEGIFLFKRPFERSFDLRCWIDCSFETALERALARTSLSPTIRGWRHGPGFEQISDSTRGGVRRDRRCTSKPGQVGTIRSWRALPAVHSAVMCGKQ